MNRSKTLVNRLSTVRPNRVSRNACSAAILFAFAIACSGCTALTQPIDGIPSDRLPNQFFTGEKNDLVPIDISLLAQEIPRNYTLGSGDVLGITVDKILPLYAPGEIPEPPPVHFARTTEGRGTDDGPNARFDSPVLCQ